jgi:hypothetical protein
MRSESLFGLGEGDSLLLECFDELDLASLACVSSSMAIALGRDAVEFKATDDCYDSFCTLGGDSCGTLNSEFLQQLEFPQKIKSSAKRQTSMESRSTAASKGSETSLFGRFSSAASTDDEDDSFDLLADQIY